MLDVPGSNPGVPTNYNRLPIKSPATAGVPMQNQTPFAKKIGRRLPLVETKNPCRINSLAFVGQGFWAILRLNGFRLFFLLAGMLDTGPLDDEGFRKVGVRWVCI